MDLYHSLLSAGQKWSRAKLLAVASPNALKFDVEIDSDHDLPSSDDDAFDKQALASLPSAVLAHDSEDSILNAVQHAEFKGAPHRVPAYCYGPWTASSFVISLHVLCVNHNALFPQCGLLCPRLQMSWVDTATTWLRRYCLPR